MACLNSHPCQSYTPLSESWRNVDGKDDGEIRCDRPGSKGAQPSYNKWFRIMGAAGDRMPDKCPGSYDNRCGTRAPVWMSAKHPSVQDGIVSDVLFCGYHSGGCCAYKQTGKVRKCPGGYYIYYLPQISTCSLAYCGEESPDDPSNKRCQCSFHLETEGIKQGPKTFTLPTLIYGKTNVWVEEWNKTTLVQVKYPNWTFTVKRVRKQLPIKIEELRACLKLLRHCPQDCEQLAKFKMTDGLSTVIDQRGTAGVVKNPLGQVMCHHANADIKSPGRRTVVFYNNDQCGTGSTHMFPEPLCCALTKIPGISSVIIWNKKCEEKFDINGIIGY